MFDIMAEQELLGIILNEDKYLEQAINNINEDHFYDKRHRFIFAYMKEVYGKGERINIVTLNNHIGVERIMEVGGTSYLSSLREGRGNFDIENYIKIVKDLSIKRRGVYILRKNADDVEAGKKLMDEAREEINRDGFESGGNKNTLLKEKDLMSEMLEAIEKRYLNGGDVLGMKTGYKKLDTTLNGFKKGELVVVAGRPGMGKTAVAINIADGLANNGNKVVLHELEMTKEGDNS